MSTFKDQEVERYGSMIYGILLEKGEREISKLAYQCKISIENTRKCLEVLHMQGLVVERRGDKWTLPSSDSSLMQDALPQSESALCSQLERSHISDEQTTEKEVYDRVQHQTARKEPYSPPAREAEHSDDDEETHPKEAVHSSSNELSSSTVSIEQVSAGGLSTTIQAGCVSLSTTAPVQTASTSTPDPGLQPYYNQLYKIIKLFQDGARDKKPHDIARVTNIGQAKKDVNRLLYVLEKYEILHKKCNENLGNPLWNAGKKLNTYTEKELLECAAEVAKGKPLQKSINGGATEGDTHIHHHHHHQHNTYIQAGQDNRMLVNQASGSSSSPARQRPALPGPES